MDLHSRCLFLLNVNTNQLTINISNRSKQWYLHTFVWR